MQSCPLFDRFCFVFFPLVHVMLPSCKAKKRPIDRFDFGRGPPLLSVSGRPQTGRQMTQSKDQSIAFSCSVCPLLQEKETAEMQGPNTIFLALVYVLCLASVTTHSSFSQTITQTTSKRPRERRKKFRRKIQKHEEKSVPCNPPGCKTKLLGAREHPDVGRLFVLSLIGSFPMRVFREKRRRPYPSLPPSLPPHLSPFN
mmetsp:Transcript_45800/g.90198  ORF Transcript_45800/g.90198 Transcript_45800/m.90198 type:complete len:199 (-) Transcript_45800:2483-3079(-)